MSFNLNNKQFKTLQTANNGEVSDATVFDYFEKEEVIWAHYHGGAIIKGFLIGKKTTAVTIEFNYQHINIKKQLMTGKCKTQLSYDAAGKIVLDEHWQWTCGDRSSGQSMLLEV